MSWYDSKPLNECRGYDTKPLNECRGYDTKQLNECPGYDTKPLNECPDYDTKLSDHEAPVILELYEMLNTPSFPLLEDSLGPWVVAPDRVLAMGQAGLFNI